MLSEEEQDWEGALSSFEKAHALNPTLRDLVIELVSDDLFRRVGPEGDDR